MSRNADQLLELVLALESYSSHLEPSFIKIKLPPTSPNASIPPTFDLSPAYVTALDDEFTRVYEEYTRRVATVKALSENMIQLWAELGTPQAQTDGMVVKYYRDSPEQLGLHEEDVARLRQKRDKLADEKKAREKRLKDLKVIVEGLWDKLGVEERDRKQFLNGNRGCGVRQINEFEDELSRLNDLKRQNMHLFVEDARYKLQELWDGLYFSEEEMLEFTPAFSEVYSDALLEAHEQEIARLEALKEQRAPTLTLIDKHRSLVKDRDDLKASSQDASRLLGRGQKGEKRDPTRLLREEKMRKRIAKDLPKVAVELRKVLEQWEDEYGRPFLVHGEPYLDQLEASEQKPVPGPRSKTPAGPHPNPTRPKSAPPSRSRTNSAKSQQAPPSRSGAKTPVGGSTLRRNPLTESTIRHTGRISPSKIPARVPLSNLNHGGNSPERRTQDYSSSTIRGKMGPPPSRAPPPKMRDLFVPPPAPTPTPSSSFRTESVMSNGSVRHVTPEDNFYDSYPQAQPLRHRAESYQELKSSMRQNEREVQNSYPVAPPVRQISNTSNTTTVSGSENWQTIEDDSEPEEDASDAYYAKLRAARGKRFNQEEYNQGAQVKKQKGIPPYGARAGLTDADGTRIISGSENNWTDEDAF